MSNGLKELILNNELSQSSVYGDKYKARLDQSTALSVSVYKDVEQMYQSIVIQYHLTDFQKKSLYSLFVGFNEIRGALDPEKLKHFSHAMNEDGELLFYRRSSIGLTNLIIHEENVIALSFIPFDANRQSSVEFSEDPSEITTWAYKFFAGN